jgi:hypothetical protein
MIEDRLGELPEQRRNEEGVVDLGRAGVHLPPFDVGHGLAAVVGHDQIVEPPVEEDKF